jgi:hypothetical protein
LYGFKIEFVELFGDIYTNKEPWPLIVIMAQCPRHMTTNNEFLTTSETTNTWKCVSGNHLFYEEKQTGKTSLERST